MNSGPIVPRPAATFLLLRDGVDGLEVFMVVRHQALVFAPGALVFPGGSVDPDDGEIAAAARSPLNEVDAAGFCVAAVREAFEECGILLARAEGMDQLVGAERLAELAATYRVPLCEGAMRFADLLASERLVPATDLLVPFAHWITPPVGTFRRFDTRFFVALAPVGHEGLHDGGEVVDSIWITPEAALAAGRAGRYKVEFPTRLNLAKVGRQRTAAEAIAVARETDIVTVRPEITKTEGGWTARIPAAAGYGGELFDIEIPPAK